MPQMEDPALSLRRVEGGSEWGSAPRHAPPPQVSARLCTHALRERYGHAAAQGPAAGVWVVGVPPMSVVGRQRTPPLSSL